MSKAIQHSKEDQQHSGIEIDMLREKVWFFFLNNNYKYLKSVNAKAQKHKGSNVMGLLKWKFRLDEY